jgi:hypothetical protein
LKKGQTTAEQAREKIRTAKSIVASLRESPFELSAADQRAEVAKRLRDRFSSLKGDERDSAARTLLKISALEYFLERWFIRDKGHPIDS